MTEAEPWAVAKIGPPDAKSSNYPYHDRACDLYKYWMAGYTEEEISLYLSMDVEEVQQDIAHVEAHLPVRTVIAHGNDRNRILLQRQQSEAFRKLMKEALEKSADDYMKLGLSPATILKEFRESTGMVEKPGAFVQVQQNTFVESGSRRGVSSAEDLIRKVLEGMKQEQPPIDIEPESSQDQETEHQESPDDVPDPDSTN